MRASSIIVLALATLTSTLVGCSSAGPRKYVFFGDPQPEKVETFEDFWSDYPFKPDDPELPLRRGKGGVIRFFKKDNYSRSILVDGDLTVNVYYSVKDGVTLTQPDSQLVLTSQELNEKHRKFDKEVGYSYHVYLDLGEYDQPEEEITILSVFKDAKTGQTTLSKEIRTTAMGTTPLRSKESEEMESEAVRWARSKVGEDVEDPIAALQEQYGARKRAKEEDAAIPTRLRETIDIEDSRFEDIVGSGGTRSVSYLEEQDAKRRAATEAALKESQEKAEYYRDLRRKRVEEYEEYQRSKADVVSPLRDSPGFSDSLNFSDATKARDRFQATQENEFAKMSAALPNAASAEYERRDAERNLDSKGGNGSTPLGVPAGFEPVERQAPIDSRGSGGSETNWLDDFEPDSKAPPTEVYLKRA